VSSPGSGESEKGGQWGKESTRFFSIMGVARSLGAWVGSQHRLETGIVHGDRLDVLDGPCEAGRKTLIHHHLPEPAEPAPRRGCLELCVTTTARGAHLFGLGSFGGPHPGFL
jgi:hypothetical protein